MVSVCDAWRQPVGPFVLLVVQEHRSLTNGDEYARGDSSHELDADAAEWDSANS